MNLFFGQAMSRGDVGRALKQPFRLLELSARPASLPKLSKLAEWRARAGADFVFAVVLDPICFLGKDEASAAIAYARRVAEALDTRFFVLRSPNHFRPGPQNERRLAELIAELSSECHTLAWEPGGLWQPVRARALAAELGVVLVQHLDDFEPSAVAYVRLLQLGVGRSRLTNRLDEFAEQLALCGDAYVVVDGPGAMQVCRQLMSLLEELAELDVLDDESDVDASDDEPDVEDNEDSEETKRGDEEQW